jgi:aminopeptidase N
MLRSQLGDSAFFAGIREYYAAHKHGTALSTDLQLALEHSSRKNLNVFFEQWLRRPGYPEVIVGWSSDEVAHKATVTVSQTGRFGYFEFPLPVVVVDRSGARRSFKVPVVAQPETRFEIDYSGDKVPTVMVDPDVTVLIRDLGRKLTLNSAD